MVVWNRRPFHPGNLRPSCCTLGEETKDCFIKSCEFKSLKLAALSHPLTIIAASSCTRRHGCDNIQFGDSQGSAIAATGGLWLCSVVLVGTGVVQISDCVQGLERPRSPSFHDLYEQNGKRHREVVFLTRFEDSDLYSRLDPDVKWKTCFLDLTERRWYVMERSADQDLEARVVAMDEGLVVEFCCEDDTVVRDYDETPTVECLQIANPVTKSHLSWFLDPPFPECPWNDELPTLVVAADRASRSFRLFLMTNTGPYSQFMYAYQSSTYIEGDTSSWQERSWDHGDYWRCTKQPQTLWNSFPTDLGTRARSAVFFRGALYAILSPSFSEYDCSLMRYDCEEDSWITIRELFFEKPAHPELTVTNDRLFMSFFHLSTSSTGTLTLEEEFSHTLHPLEIVEIQIPENASRTMFQIPAARLDHFFGEPFTGLACVVPCVSAIGSCTSAALVSSSSGKVTIYNAVSGSAETLPSHPLRRANLNQSNPQRRRRRGSRVRYGATYKHLSFRDILREKHSSHPFDFEERAYFFDARA